MTSNISVIIPCLNERSTLGRLLKTLRAYPELEIIVADGGSTDETLIIAGHYGALTVSSKPGRSIQQNAGAKLASFDTLLFLHSDTILPEGFPSYIRNLLEQPGTAAGAFRLQINAPGIGYRLIEWGANLRSTLFKMVYGDQALFVRRQTFRMVGGFPDQEILEDVGLVQRLKKMGSIKVAPVAAMTSARRWQHLGLIRTIFLNQFILAGYFLKVSPEKLERLYYRKTRR